MRGYNASVDDPTPMHGKAELNTFSGFKKTKIEGEMVGTGRREFERLKWEIDLAKIKCLIVCVCVYTIL